VAEPSRGGLKVHAPAKVNLYLHVTGRRADGYHLLDSLVVFAGVADRLIASPAPVLTFEARGPFAGGLGAADDNLVLRAADGLAELAGVRTGAAIVLEKNLPVAAGIGGGSADAAAALRLLARLWKVRPRPDALADLAAGLGADLPVCLFGRPAFLSGFGEAVTPAPALPDAWLVLVNPGVALATAEVFSRRTAPPGTPGRFPPVADLDDLVRVLAPLRNDLAEVAAGLVPQVGFALAALDRLPGCRLARMSGSGATCFGLFATADAARAAARRLRRDRPGWWVRAAPILRRRAPVRVAARDLPVSAVPNR